jgi:hypothetical protein
MAKRSLKKEIKRLEVPQRGEPILHVEYETGNLKESFVHSVRSMYGYPGQTKPPETLIQDRIDFATQYAEKHMPQLLNTMLIRLRSEAISYSARAVGIAKGEHLAVHRSLLQDENKEAKERLQARTPGQYSQWQRLELYEAVLNALRTIEPDKRNYDGVQYRLIQTHPDKAPASGGALRQLLIRFEINWKGLKAYSIRE